MKVSGKDAAALRSVLRGDADSFDGLEEESGSAYGEGFAALMATAFISAARERFPAGWSSADIIRFVAMRRSG